MEKKRKRRLSGRLVAYFLGLFIMTLGIAISVKSDLGVSPVSSLPYAFTLCWGVEMGLATFVMHCVLVLFQILLLRKKFRLKLLLQIPVGVVFGYFTTFCNGLMDYLPSTENIIVRFILLIVSVILVAIGISFYLPADIMPLAGEGFVQAFSDATRTPFPRAKIVSDVGMVALAIIICRLKLFSFGSVGIGTIVSALLTGIILAQLEKIYAKILRRNSS